MSSFGQTYGWDNPADNERLAVLWKEGHSGTQIGLRMHRSKCSIIARAHRLGLPRRRSPIAPANVNEPAPVWQPIPLLCDLVPLSAAVPLQLPTMPAVPPPPRSRHCLFILAMPARGIPAISCDEPRASNALGRPSSYCAAHHAACSLGFLPVKPKTFAALVRL